MKNFKSKTALMMALTLAMTASVGQMAFAAPIANAPLNTATTQVAPAQKEIKSTLEGMATVEAVGGDNQFTVKVDQLTLVLNISPATLFVDANTGVPSSLKDIKVGDKVYVYYSAAMTRSLPPQSSAIAVVTGIQKDHTLPKLMTVKKIVDSKENQIRFLNTDEDMIVTLLKDNPISPFKTKQIVSYKDVQPGSRVFVWYDIVLESYPGQTAALKTVLIDTPSSTVQTPVKLLVNDQHIDLGSATLVERNGKYLVPLKDVSKALGFSLTWNAKTRTASMDNGDVKTAVTVGKDAYYKASSKAIGLTNTFSYKVSPELIGGKLYVPADLFKLLYSNDAAVTVHGDVLSITSSQK